MLSYDDLVDELESAWMAAGLHEHDLVESVQPDVHERSYKAELFPDHADPLDEESMPPWVEVSFTWSAFHQLRSEGYTLHAADPLDLTWVYHVIVHKSMRDRSDSELVRLFQKAITSAISQFTHPEVPDAMTPLAVEVRRIYQSDGGAPTLAYVQLISPNLTDLSDLWDESDPRELRSFLHSEVYLTSLVIQALARTFAPGSLGNTSSYRSVDTA